MRLGKRISAARNQGVSTARGWYHFETTRDVTAEDPGL